MRETEREREREVARESLQMYRETRIPIFYLIPIFSGRTVFPEVNIASEPKRGYALTKPLSTRFTTSCTQN